MKSSIPTSKSAFHLGLFRTFRPCYLPAIFVVIWTRTRHFFGINRRDALMMVVIAYDVNTETSAGKKRLRQVARQCTNYGLRVQNSVFECLVDAAQWKQLQYRLQQLIDPEKDSLRFYYLQDHWRSRVEHFGAKPGTDLEGPLIL